MAKELKKKIAVVYDAYIVDTPEEAVKIYEKLGLQIKYRIFELGDEFQVDMKTIVSRLEKVK